MRLRHNWNTRGRSEWSSSTRTSRDLKKCREGRCRSREAREVFVSSHQKGDCLVYFGKIREEEDGHLLIKIGSTKDLHERAKLKFDQDVWLLCPFLRCSPPPSSVSSRSSSRPIPASRPTSSRKSIHDGHSSNREVFLMDEVEVANAVALAKRHAPAYNDRATVEQIVEYELTKYKGAV